MPRKMNDMAIVLRWRYVPAVEVRDVWSIKEPRQSKTRGVQATKIRQAIGLRA
jgi:hypothetical protein